MKGRAYPCTRKGCPGTRPRHRFLCLRHWDMLPGQLRRLIGLAALTGRIPAELRARAHAEIGQIEQHRALATITATEAYARIQRQQGEREFEEERA